ncbi:MAG: septum formation protein Maf [Chitinophagaceae bacterium]|nr:septum formation protein Maf [Chitinophagaceae bacterium]MCW5926923.1 septum formation protein Maf [Chitinophagaceae bacterium]
MSKIILASQSPRRKQLLEWAEIDFDIIIPDTDETFPENIAVTETAQYIARQKALAIPGTVMYKQYVSPPAILAADTIVVCNGKILGKPKDKNDAAAILSMLSGKKHEVITGVTILHGDREIIFSDTTEVWFHPLSADQIDFYIDKYKPFDKAGAYAIQEWIGVVGIQRINGDFYNVMGLPVSRVIQHLSKM